MGLRVSEDFSKIFGMLTSSELSSRLGAIMSDLAEILDSIESEPEVDRTPGDALTLAEEGKCLFCAEPLNRAQERAKPLRGLHYACYQVVKRRMGERRISDEEAEKRGWILKPKPTGRPRKVGRIDAEPGDGSPPVAPQQSETEHTDRSKGKEKRPIKKTSPQGTKTPVNVPTGGKRRKKNEE